MRGVENYRLALDVDGPIGSGLLHSFAISVAFTVLVVGASLGDRDVGAVLVNSRVPRASLVSHDVPGPVRDAGLRVGDRLELHARPRQRRDQRAARRPAPADNRPFWLLGTNAFWSIVMTTVWRLWPFAFLMMLAGMQNIPRELYEAAAVDGAGPLRQWRSITLPLLAP